MSTTDLANIAKIEEPKSSSGVFDLPCGYLSPDGMLHTEVAIRELTGAEEDILASRQLSPFKKYNELLTRCTERVGNVTDREKLNSIVKTLPVGDRIYILLAIRRVTIGDDYSFNHKCPNENCGATKSYTINLSELDKQNMPEPKKRVYDITLPSGAKARYRVSTGEDEERSMAMDKTKDDDKLSKGILMRLELLNGEPPTLDMVKRMKWKDRIALRQAWNSVEGGVNTEIEMVCPQCGTEFKSELEISPSFFFPSETSKP